MRTRVLSLLFLIAALPLLANPLRNAVAAGATSIAWTVQTAGTSICCCDGQSWQTTKDLGVESREILAIARLDGGRITKLRLTQTDCSLEGVRLLGPVSADASIDFLLEHRHDTEQVVSALALHDHPRVVQELITLARSDRSTAVRRSAIFWLGQRAGEKAAGELRRAVDHDPEDEVRQHAVFAISQLPADRAVPLLTGLVKTHRSPAIRKRAMFWLAQTGDPRALALIEEILLR